MLDEGVYVIAFSYPVVPQGKARIRVQLSAAHSEEDVRRCVDAFVSAQGVGGLSQTAGTTRPDPARIRPVRRESAPSDRWTASRRGQTGRTRRVSPPRGRRVTNALMAGRFHGCGRVTSWFRSRPASTTASSTSAKSRPMHRRGPSPNGT